MTADVIATPHGLGPCFPLELAGAGFDPGALPFVIYPDHVEIAAGTPDAVRSQVADLVAAHDPAKPMPPGAREATGYALISALTDAQKPALANLKPSDLARLTARPDPYPETNPLVARVAKVIGTTPKAWFDAALKPSA